MAFKLVTYLVSTMIAEAHDALKKKNNQRLPGNESTEYKTRLLAILNLCPRNAPWNVPSKPFAST